MHAKVAGEMEAFRRIPPRQARATSFPGSLILPPGASEERLAPGGKMRDPGNEVEARELGHNYSINPKRGYGAATAPCSTPVICLKSS